MIKKNSYESFQKVHTDKRCFQNLPTRLIPPYLATPKTMHSPTEVRTSLASVNEQLKLAMQQKSRQLSSLKQNSNNNDGSSQNNHLHAAASSYNNHRDSVSKRKLFQRYIDGLIGPNNLVPTAPQSPIRKQ